MSDTTEVDLGVLAEQARLQESINDLNKAQLEFVKQQAEIEKQRLEDIGSFLSAGRQAAVEQQTLIDAKQRELQIEQDIYLQTIKARQELEAEIPLLEEATQEQLNQLEALDNVLRSREESILKVQKELEAQRLLNNASDDFADGLAKSLGITTKLSDTMIGKFAEATALLGKEKGLAAAADELKESLSRAFSPANLLASSFVNIQQGAMALVGTVTTLLLGLDTARASFARTTNSLEDITPVLSATRDELAFVGVSFEDASGAAAALFAGFNKFAKASVSTKKELIALASTNEKLGVSLEDTVGLLDITVNALGMTIDESKKLNSNLQGLATDIGRTFKQVTSDFAALNDQLLVYGSQQLQVFADLQKISKETGVEATKLASSFGRAFDTFEGAANAAGRLNAVLGRSIFMAEEFLFANEAERIKIISSRLKAEGLMFKNMEKFEQLNIASALGIQDLSMLSKVLNADTRNLTASQRLQIQTEERRNQQLMNAVSALDKVKNAFLSLFQEGAPVVEMLNGFADSLSKMAANAQKGIGPLSFLISNMETLFEIIVLYAGIKMLSTLSFAFLGLSTALGLTGGALVLTGGLFIALGLAISALVGYMLIASPSQLVIAFFSFAAAITLVGQAAKLNTTSLLALGAAVGLIGAGVFLAAQGIAAMAEALAPLSGEQLVALGGILLGMGVGIGLLAASSVAAGPPLLILGAALLLIGGAIALVGLGISTALQPFAEMLQYVNMETAAAFTVMAAGIGLMATSLIALAGSLALIKSDDLRSIADVLKSITEFKDTSLQVGVKQVKEVMDKSIQIAKNPEGAEAVKGIFEAARAASVAIARVGVQPAPQVAAATASPTSGRPIQINVVLDRQGINKIGDVLVSEREFRDKISGDGF